MINFYTSGDAIISLPCESEQAYTEDCDYDLLGRPLSWRSPPLVDPIPYFRNFLHDSSWSIMATIFVSVVGTLLFLLLMNSVPPLWLLVQNEYVTFRALSKERKVWEKRKQFLQREDHDRYAAVYCRSVANKLGVASPNRPIPKDLPDYEAVRFVFQQPWLTEKTHMDLQKTDFDPSWDQMVEGELEDMLTLAVRRNLMFKRQPLSLFGKLRARRLLAQGEGEREGLDGLTPEMLLIQGWEALYRKHLKRANEENYYWWVSQNKTLPVESREVTGRLRPIIEKGRKMRQLSVEQPSEVVKQMSHGFSRWPHEPADFEGDGNFSRFRKDSRPRIALSPPRLSREEGLISEHHQVDESLMLRKILGMEHAHKARLKRPRRRRSTLMKSDHPFKSFIYH